MSFSFFKQYMNKTKGFTLIELLVVIAIIFILMSVALFDYASQRENVALSSASEGFVATIRQAQNYATRVREHNGSFDIGYGVRVEEGATEIQLFVDEDKNREFDLGEDVVERFIFEGGVVISDVCANDPCHGAVDLVDIVFIRPAVAPVLTGHKSGPNLEPSQASFTIESSGGKTKTVIVNTSGQISIK